MIIEKFDIKSDAVDGNEFIISGRSLESILSRRIVWKQTTINGNLQNGIQKLLNENVIDPIPTNLKSYRKISNFIFEKSTDSRITSLTMEAQYTGDNLYDVIQDICDAYNIGFKVTLNDKNQFVFSLYSGDDRSYQQTDNPYVVFSKEFDNITDSEYYESYESYSNVTLIGGEGEGNKRKYTTYSPKQVSELERYELFTDARDISSDNEDGSTMSTSDYNKLLSQRGKEKLAECQVIKSFEGDFDFNGQYKYGKDFFLGDIVQIENEYGISSQSRVSEVIQSQDDSGKYMIPTLTDLTYNSD
jgi:hypothetical protein